MMSPLSAAISEETLATLQQMKDYIDRYEHFPKDHYGIPKFDYIWGEEFHEFLKPRCSVLSRCLSSDLSKAVCSKQPKELKTKCMEKRHSFCNKCLVTKDSIAELVNCEKQRIDCSFFKSHFTKHFRELKRYVDGFWNTYHQEQQKEMETKKIQNVPEEKPNPAMEKSTHEGDDPYDEEKNKNQ